MFTPSSMWENNRRASQGETFISSSAGLTSQSAGVWPRVTGPIFFLLFLIFLYFFFFLLVPSIHLFLNVMAGQPHNYLKLPYMQESPIHFLSFYFEQYDRKTNFLGCFFFLPVYWTSTLVMGSLLNGLLFWIKEKKMRWRDALTCGLEPIYWYHRIQQLECFCFFFFFGEEE